VRTPRPHLVVVVVAVDRSGMADASADAAAKAAKQRAQCEAYKASGLKNSAIKFLMKAMTRQGCCVSPDYFQCRRAATVDAAGALEHDDQGRTSVSLFFNCLRSEKHAHDTMLHELVHAYDYCRAHVDWSNLHHHACTEIRAANLSGDCNFGSELSRGRIFFQDHHKECVKRRAALSVAQNRHCESKEQAAAAVEQVFDTCYNDVEPFGSVP
jgi:inner membrane protease ATP23